MEPIWKTKKYIEIIYDAQEDIFHVRDNGEYVVVDLKNIDPDSKYAREAFIEAFGEAMLRADIRKAEKPQPYQRSLGILFEGQLKKRRDREKRASEGVVDEIITAAGSPDGQRIYNRSHPEGRRINSEEQRKEHGASFYGG
jgi:hypothetical protein